MSGMNSISSPGVQFRALQMVSSVEKRIALALFVLRIDRLFTEMPVSSESSLSFMFLSNSR